MEFKSVNRMKEQVRLALPDSKIAKVFENCFGNTIEKTITVSDKKTAFVITGDIPAMWLRDSSCQLRPYLFLCRDDEELSGLIEKVIWRQFDFIAKDPYANAFNDGDTGMGHQDDITDMKPFIWERKYEIDSLCFPIQLSYLFWKNSGRTAHFTEEWKKSAEIIMNVFHTEQYHMSRSDYSFERKNCRASDTLPENGKGNPVKEGIGLVWSGFRPSDDACRYGYLIPSNMFLCVVMEELAEISTDVIHDQKLADRAQAFSAEVRAAIERYAVVEEGGKRFYAYEVDGLGNYLIMDDANLPSLLSTPYFGYAAQENDRYHNTAEIILSERNPYYYSGKCLKGIGSPHTPKGYVWDIGIAMEGLICSTKEEKERILRILVENDGGTGLMHESINCDNDRDYTREWFSWANAVFTELVMSYLGMELKK